MTKPKCSDPLMMLAAIYIFVHLRCDGLCGPSERGERGAALHGVVGHGLDDQVCGRRRQVPATRRRTALHDGLSRKRTREGVGNERRPLVVSRAWMSPQTRTDTISGARDHQ